jgi:hypothetical protein
MLSKSFFWKRVAREAENGVEHKLMSSPASNLKRLCGLSAVGCRLSAVGCRLSAVGLILLLGLGLFAFFKIKKTVPAQSISSSGKELMLSQQVQHLGKINQHEAKEFSFTLTNTSQETIEVEKISQSCGCTQARVDQSQLKPGESTMLRGSLTAQDRVGEFGSVIQVNLSNGNVAEVQVGAKAVTVLHGPSNLELGAYYMGEKPTTQRFSFKKGDAEAVWDQLKLKADGMVAEVMEKGEIWELEVRAPQMEEIGVFRRDLVLECWEQGGEKPVAQLPLTVSWKSKSRQIEITPMAAYFGLMKPGEEKTVRLKVKNLSGESIRLEKVEFPKGMEATAALVPHEREPNQFYLEIRTRGLPSGDGGVSGSIYAAFRTHRNLMRCSLSILGKLK